MSKYRKFYARCARERVSILCAWTMPAGPIPPSPKAGEQRVYSPALVARRLSVSGQSLRRLAATYERVCEPLPRDERGRMWSEEAMERLKEARALVRAGRAVSVEAALRDVLGGTGAEESAGGESQREEAIPRRPQRAIQRLPATCWRSCA